MKVVRSARLTESGLKKQKDIPSTIVPATVEEVIEPNIVITYGALEIVGQPTSSD